jgi:hypothetical protein
MDLQYFQIKFLEAILPDAKYVIDFAIESQYRSLPFEIATAETAEKWAVFGDDVNDNRKIQSQLKQPMKVKFSTKQNIKYQLAQIADFVQVQLSDTTQPVLVRNIEFEYSEKTDKTWEVVMSFIVNDLNEISSTCESNFIQETGLYNELKVRINKPTYELFVFDFVASANGYIITVPNEREYANLSVGNEFFWTTNFFNNKELFLKAEILSKTSTTITIELFYDETTLIDVPSSVPVRVLLSNIPEVNFFSTTITAMQYSLYTKFIPKFQYEKEVLEEIIDTELIKTSSLTSHKERLKVLIYVSFAERWKLKYLPFATSMTFEDKKNNKTYTFVQNFDSFVINEREDLIGLFEVEFNAIVSNIVSKENI